ncbi:Diacylglycerol kinase catalytic domain [Geosmithia morbida]|uniref:Diacylglycerol kinase catalytic domain n=1 Tax=Geosmithia morbida TaxID=1094350 RepID=A0A9P4Z365_9HYPO|nr:Diacylglycerol kinase catalytic domain [Geosmithia morbida]KAF4126671.1 Diacylglycerol kinase catalytic domain [Geosmithia morbida]
MIINTADGQLRFDSGNGDIYLDTKDVLLVIPKSPEGFTICSLKEEPALELILVESSSSSLPDILRPLALDKAGSLPDHLVSSATHSVDIIVSVKSGTGTALVFWQDVLRPLLQLVAPQGREASDGVAHNVVITQSADSISQFAQELWSSLSSPDKSRTVVLLTGDGGIVDLLRQREVDGDGDGKDGSAPATRPTVSLMPLGTGNALFHSLHKPLYAAGDGGPSPLVVAVRTLFRGQASPLPIFRASFTEGSYIVPPGGGGVADERQSPPARVRHLDGAVVASYGFHASLTYESDTPEYRVHGAKRFGMAAQELLRTSHAYAATLEMRAPGSPTLETAGGRDGTHSYVLASLVSNLERTFTISPDARPLDGQLRVVHFGDVGRERTMEAMTKAYDGGKHVHVAWPDGQKVHYEPVEEMRVTIREDEDRWCKVCIDGTTVHVPTGGQMNVRMLEETPLQVLINPDVLLNT